MYCSLSCKWSKKYYTIRRHAGFDDKCSSHRIRSPKFFLKNGFPPTRMTKYNTDFGNAVLPKTTSSRCSIDRCLKNKPIVQQQQQQLQAEVDLVHMPHPAPQIVAACSHSLIATRPRDTTPTLTYIQYGTCNYGRSSQSQKRCHVPLSDVIHTMYIFFQPFCYFDTKMYRNPDELNSRQQEKKLVLSGG